MKINCLLATKCTELENKVVRAFYHGLQIVPGLEIRLSNKYFPADIYVTWGIYKKYSAGRFNELEKAMKKYELTKATHIVLEKGFINRNYYYMVGVGGLNGRANFYNENSPPDRLYKIKIGLGPWNVPNYIDKVLICGQVPTDSAVEHIDYCQWTHDTIIDILAVRKQIIYRFHPDLKKKPINTTTPQYKEVKKLYDIVGGFGKLVEISQLNNIYDDFKRVDLMISFNSNSNVDATLFGLPNLCCDDGSMVKDICRKGLTQMDEAPILLMERGQWLRNLTYSQYNIFEIKHGIPQKRLLNNIRDG